MRNLLILALGTMVGQIGALAMGIVFVIIALPARTELSFLSRDGNAFVPAALLAVVLLGEGLRRGWRYHELIMSGNVRVARVVFIERDVSGDEPDFVTKFEYLESSGETKTCSVARRSKGFILGEEVRLFVHQNGKSGILECELPVGIKYSGGPLEMNYRQWLKILLIPFLSIFPLVFAVPKVTELALSVNSAVGWPFLQLCPLGFSILWLSTHAKEFTFAEVAFE